MLNHFFSVSDGLGVISMEGNTEFYRPGNSTLTSIRYCLDPLSDPVLVQVVLGFA